MWISGRPLPSGFNDSYLWLLPKSDLDNPDGPICSPDKTRPLSGANTDAKIFAHAFAHPINEILPSWAIKHQSGYIADRCILRNVIDVDTSAAQQSLHANSTAATLLFDFCAAFPSLSRIFIFIALAFLGIPPHIIQALRNLYSDNDRYYKYAGNTIYAFCSGSGVRQGCPASSTIFILVTDCLIRFLSSHLSPFDTIRVLCR